MNRLRVVLTTLASIFTGFGCAQFAAHANLPVAKAPQTTAKAAPRKRALLVGVSGYCRDPTKQTCGAWKKHWWDLNTGADVDAIEQMLRAKLGFQEGEIRVLKTKAETTHAGIVNAFRTFLISQTQAGDIVYFHFSGHGGQAPDDDRHGPNPNVGDELDGLDESLIPSDYAAQDNKANDIRDDEVEQLLAQLAGRHVVMTVDSCFSGTITRGGRGLVRGLRWNGPVSASGSASGREDGPGGLTSSGGVALNNYTVITAARKDQTANETIDPATGKEMGMLSYALVKALESAGPETTYRDIFEKINDEVSRAHREQDPQLEGQRDKLLFSGIARPPQPYIGVSVKQGKVTLRAGSLQAMTVGSRFSIYPPGADPKSRTPIAQGEIVAVGATSSVLKVTPTPAAKMLEELRTARAVETFHSYGDVRLNVLVEDAAKRSLGSDTLGVLQAHDLLNTQATAADWHVRVCKDRCADEKLSAGQEDVKFSGGVTLMRGDGSIITRIAEGPDIEEKVTQALEGEARWRFIKGLKNETSLGLRVKLRLVPVTDIKVAPDTGRALSARDLAEEVQPGAGGRIELHDGDTVRIEVMNAGTKDVYVSVLDLRSDGSVGPLWPHPQLPASMSDNKIPAKRDARGNPVWQRIPFPFVFKIGEPYGPEVFKALVTEQPSDFSPLFSREEAEGIQRGESTRGEKEASTPLGQLLLTGTTGRTRGKARGPTKRGDERDTLLGAEDAAQVGVIVEGWTTCEVAFDSLPHR
jgi:hypothetical protein